MTSSNDDHGALVRSASQLALAGSLGATGWAVQRLDLVGDDEVVLTFVTRTGGHRYEARAGKHPPRGVPARRFGHCAIWTRDSARGFPPASRRELSAIVSAVGASLDARLAEHPDATLRELFGGSRRAGRVVFGRDFVREALGTTLGETAAGPSGWRLVDVYPTSHLASRDDPRLAILAELRRDADGGRLHIRVAPFDPDRRYLERTEHFAIDYLSLGRQAPDDAATVASLAAFALKLVDHPGLEVVFPGAEQDVTMPVLEAAPSDTPDEAASDAVLNLAVNCDCGQECSFCSQLDVLPPETVDEAADARLRAQLAENRRRGTRALRVNGYDPLAYPGIVGLLDYARQLGYASFDVYSPFTALADPTLCARVATRLPADTRYHVPLYGLEAAVHDRVVGRVGSFDRVTRALDNLREHAAPRQVVLSVIPTVDNLDQVGPLAAWAAERGYGFKAHTLFACTESPSDRYFTAVPTESQIADALVAHWRRTGRVAPVRGVKPCVLFPRVRAAGGHLRAWLGFETDDLRVPGVEYRDARIQHAAQADEHDARVAQAVPCPYAADCALAQACPKAVLRSYVERYGLGELAPVPLRDLLEAEAGHPQDGKPGVSP